MPEGLKIQVGADVQQAVKALEQDVPKAVDKSVASFTKLSASASTASSAISKTIPKAISSTNAAISQLAGTIKTQGASGFQILGESGQLAGSKLRSLSGVLATTATQIPVLSSAASAGSVGLLKMLGTFGLVSAAANILSSVIVEVGKAIFGANDFFSGAEIAAGKFGNTLKSVKEDVESLKDALDFKGRVQKLQIELAGLSGASLSIGGSGIDIKNNITLIQSLDDKIKNLTASKTKILEEINRLDNAVTKLTGKKTPGQKLIEQFGSIEAIPESFIKKLDKDGISLVSQFRDVDKQIKAFEKERIVSGQQVVTDLINIPIQVNKEVEAEQKRALAEQKRLNDLAKADYEAYVNEVISRAKKLSDFFKGRISITPDFTVFDTKADEFKKSLQFLKDFDSKNFTALLRDARVEIPTIFDFLKEDKRSALQKQLDELGKSMTLPVTLDLSKPGKAFQNLQKSGADALAAMKKIGEDSAKAFNSALESGLTEGLSGLGEGLGNALAGGGIGDAFKAFASSIGEALQAMGKQIIGIGVAALLAKEALKTLFANPVTAILAGTALVAAGAALKSALSGGVKGFASGGLVSGPQFALIGEGSGTSKSNPEVVAPLDKLKGMLSGFSGGMQLVTVTGRLRGNDMILQNARTSRAQRRAGVR